MFNDLVFYNFCLFFPLFQQSYKCLVFSGKSGYICIEFDRFLLLSSNTSLEIWEMFEMAHFWVSFSSHINLQTLGRHYFYTNNLLSCGRAYGVLFNFVDCYFMSNWSVLILSKVFIFLWCFILFDVSRYPFLKKSSKHITYHKPGHIRQPSTSGIPKGKESTQWTDSLPVLSNATHTKQL